MTRRSKSGLLACVFLAGCSGNEATQTKSSGDAGRGGSATGGVGGNGAGTVAGGTSGSAGSGQSGGTSGTTAGTSTGGGAGVGAGAGAGGGTSGSGGASSAGDAGTGGSAGKAAGTPREEALPDLTTVRQEHAVAALAGEIYVIGGYDPNATASVDAYDPVARSWRAVRDFPSVLNHANAAVVGNTLYVTGFYVGSSMTNTSRQVFSYDPVADAWTERTPMPDGTQRGTGCVAVLGTKIYVFGGGRGGMTVTDASAYDTMGDSWQALPPLPESREHCVAGAIDGILYIAAGRANGITGFRPATLAFDPGVMSYSMKAPLPTPRGGVAGAVLNGRLYVFGGEGNAAVSSGVFPNIDAYDPASNGWEALPPLDTPRHGYGAATLDGRIYLAGGATAQGFGASSENSVFYFE